MPYRPNTPSERTFEEIVSHGKFHCLPGIYFLSLKFATEKECDEFIQKFEEPLSVLKMSLTKTQPTPKWTKENEGIQYVPFFVNFNF